jgi:hypothetical protein
MYLLYLSQDYLVKEIVFLGVGQEPSTLYQNALNPEMTDKNNKYFVEKWLARVKNDMSEKERREMDHTFMYAPFIAGSYSIKGMTLSMKKVFEY